jgi:hypothetical protein
MTPTVHLLPNPAAERRGQADVGPSLLGFASERQCGGSGLHAAGCSAGASIEGEIRDVAARSATLHGELLYNDFEGLFGMNRSVRTREVSGARAAGDPWSGSLACAGRFTTRDTLLTEHPYVYCAADPVNAVDPDGSKWAKPFVGGVTRVAGHPVTRVAVLYAATHVLSVLFAIKIKERIENSPEGSWGSSPIDRKTGQPREEWIENPYAPEKQKWPRH